MNDNDIKIGPFGLRDALYLSLGALAMSLVWREFLWWRFAVEDLRSEQRLLLNELRRVEAAVGQVDAKLRATKNEAEAEKPVARPRSRTTPAVSKSDKPVRKARRATSNDNPDS